MEKRLLKQWAETVGAPSLTATAESRRQMQDWFAQTAPLIQWDVIQSPLGSLYLAATSQGLYRVDFGITDDIFLSKLDPLARTEHNPSALAPFVRQLSMYFAGNLSRFDLPLDLERLTPFQQRVLQIARGIPTGKVWTYGQVAQALDRPKASRAVGQALGRNPIPIVIPCHRVVAGDGSLGGYSGGLDRKRQLLHLEGVL